MLKIISIEEPVIAYFPFLIVSQGGNRDEEGKRKIEEASLAIKKGYIDFLPKEIEGTKFCSTKFPT